MGNHKTNCRQQQFSNQHCTVHKLKERTLQHLSQPTTPKKKKDTKWTTFTYTTPHIRKITNLFKNTDIKMAFKTINALRQLTKPITHTRTPPQECSDIYGLTCNTCQMTCWTD